MGKDKGKDLEKAADKKTDPDEGSAKEEVAQGSRKMEKLNPEGTGVKDLTDIQDALQKLVDARSKEGEGDSKEKEEKTKEEEGEDASKAKDDDTDMVGGKESESSKGDG